MTTTSHGFLGTIGLLGMLGLFAAAAPAATVWHVGTGPNASDTNPGTAGLPVQSVTKAVSLAKPGDTVVFSAGNYRCPQIAVPDGRPELPIILRSDGKGKVIFTNDGSGHILLPGSYNTVDGIEFHMLSDTPRGSGINVARKEHVTIRNCRFFACQIGVSASSARYLSISNSEMAYSGHHGIHLNGSG